jgi:hypothetical protein
MLIEVVGSSRHPLCRLDRRLSEFSFGIKTNTALYLAARDGRKDANRALVEHDAGAGIAFDIAGSPVDW